MNLIDTHVHIRTRFPRSTYLDHTWTNFAESASELKLESFLGVLMLTESHTEDAFRELRSAATSGERWGAWRLETTGDAISVRARRDTATILIVAGRQIDTAEGLEVSALGTSGMIADGTSLAEVLARAAEAGAVCVLPWAPGKWMFGRGRRLRDLLGRDEPLSFYLGDNGGRPWLWPEPTPMRMARRRGLPVLPGSDPLPFDVEMERVGSFGLCLEVDLSGPSPGEALIERMRRPEGLDRHYGRLASPWSFLWKELTMQWTRGQRKRMASVRSDE